MGRAVAPESARAGGEEAKPEGCRRKHAVCAVPPAPGGLRGMGEGGDAGWRGELAPLP